MIKLNSIVLFMSNLEEIFSGYKIESKEKVTGYKPITFWIPEDSKTKYDKIQDFTHKQFAKN